MPYYVHLRRSADEVLRGDEPYETYVSAHKDAELGAKQIVGDRLRTGSSLQKAVDDKAFAIADEAGQLVVLLPFWDLIRLD